MAREFRSISGQPMALTDDRIMCIISDEKWRQTTNLAGEKIVGAATAVSIRQALRAEGFEIVRAAPK